MLKEQQITTLRQIYAANSGALIELIAERLAGRGVERRGDAFAAARKSLDLIWTNPVIGGDAATILGGTIFTPNAGALAGGSTASLAGWYTLLSSESYQPLHDSEVRDAARRLVSGH